MDYEKTLLQAMRFDLVMYFLGILNGTGRIGKEKFRQETDDIIQAYSSPEDYNDDYVAYWGEKIQEVQDFLGIEIHFTDVITMGMGDEPQWETQYHLELTH